MRLAELGRAALRRALRGKGLRFATGPFRVCVRSPLEVIADGISVLYADHRLAASEDFIDFHVSLVRPRSPRRWLRPQLRFVVDDRSPFNPLPLHQALPVLEWGLNWCVANHAHRYLMFHAAVLERGGRGLLLPGSPGAGKSTLCAALLADGWRLLSDELALLGEHGALVPLPRPVSLKNESIEVIRRRVPGAVFGPATRETDKGTVAHLRPPAESVERADETVLGAWVVFPQWAAGAGWELERIGRGKGFMQLAANSFNYHVLGVHGFRRLTALVDGCDCLRLRYGDLTRAVRELGELAATAPRPAPPVPGRRQG